MATSAVFAGCVQSNQASDGRAQMVLLVSVDSTVSAVGYGWVHNCRVERVVKGDSKDVDIALIVLAGDAERESLLTGPAREAGRLEMGFARHGTAEKYRLAPISGFVDSDSTSWEITYIKHSGRKDGR